MVTIGKCSVCGKKGPLGIDDRCSSCLEDMITSPPICDECGDDLSDEEMEADETTCYNCQKGKNEED